LAELSGEPRATREACLLPSADGVLSSILYSDAPEDVSFIPFEQAREGVVWLYSGFGFVLILSKYPEGAGCPQGFEN